MIRYYKKIYPKVYQTLFLQINPLLPNLWEIVKNPNFNAIAKKGYSNNELFFIISHLISILTKGKIKKHKRTIQEPLKKPTNDIPQPESISPTGEIQK